jgi:hypothetical protein
MNPYNDVLNKLQDYILTNEKIDTILTNYHNPLTNEKIDTILTNYHNPLTNEKIDTILTNYHNPLNNTSSTNNTSTNPSTNNPSTSSTNTFPHIQSHLDTLFWGFYIITNGELKYETIYNKNSVLAKQHKIELLLNIRKKKDIIKTYKFDTITNIESNLANDNNLNIKTFLTLCAVENINILYVNKHSYYELLMNDTPIIYIVRENTAKKYEFELATTDIVTTIRNSLYKIESINKPIKAISYYKVNELVDICNKLAIDICGKHTKNNLYEAIIQYL